MKSENAAFTDLLRFLAIAGVALVAVPDAVAQADLPEPEASQTMRVEPVYRNQWFTAAPAPPGEQAKTTCFFGGGVWGDVQIPPVPPGAGTPSDGTVYLLRTSFGQDLARSVPFPGFVDATRTRVAKMLYYADADNPAGGCVDDPGTGRYCRDTAALRYKDLLYTTDPCISPGSCDPLEVVNRLEAREASIADFYGDTERAKLVEAERDLRDGLKYAPWDRNLRWDLLELYHARVTAEAALAKERLVEAVHRRLEPPPPGGWVVDAEIDSYKAALGQGGTPGGLRFAMQPYFELLRDPMGVDVTTLDPTAVPGTPFGYYLFRREVPSRSQYAARRVVGNQPRGTCQGGDQTCRTSADCPGGVACSLISGTCTGPGRAPCTEDSGCPVREVCLAPVLDGSGPIFSGYKDLVLLLGNLADVSDAAAELARRFVMRSEPGDLAQALNLVTETHQRVLLDGEALISVFPEGSIPPPGDQSGLNAAIAGWRSGLTRLDEVRNFIRGDANILGFVPDFLMLAQNSTVGGQTAYDTFDALWPRIDPNNASGPTGQALGKFNEAIARYDDYRGYNDQVASQFASQNEDYQARLRAIVGKVRGEAGYERPYECGAQPAGNEGSEICLQLQSIDIAGKRIESNRVRMDNVFSQIYIEIDLAGREQAIQNAIAQVYLRYGEAQAAITEEIGAINASQQYMNTLYGSVSVSLSFGASFGLSVSYNPFAPMLAAINEESELAKGALSANKERLSAMERAEVVGLEGLMLQVQSQARIKQWMLEAKQIAADSAEAGVLLLQESSRLVSLLTEKADVERRMDEANVLLSKRYYADPVHRLRMQSAMVQAEHSFVEGQEWAFFAARALQYKWNSVLPGGSPGWTHTWAGRSWSGDSVFHIRNAQELEQFVLAMDDFDTIQELGTVQDDYYDWFSVREDFFGYKLYEGTGLALYEDPLTGRMVNAIQAFRSRLRQLLDTSGNVMLDFSTVRETPGDTFFRGPRLNPDGTCCLSKGLYLDKIIWLQITLPGSHTLGRSLLTGTLTYGGSAFVRRRDVGASQDPNRPDRVSGEMTAYTTRYWRQNPTTEAWESTEGLTSEVVMELTRDPRTPPTVTEIEVFEERSVAATGWRLVIPTVDLGTPVLNIDELNDVEIRFYHKAHTRP